MPPLTPEQVTQLIDTILSGSTLDKASALFEVIKAVSDPSGDADRFECAVEAMRAIDPQTREYEAWFQGRVSSSSQARIPV